jgi:hypothetical protein
MIGAVINNFQTDSVREIHLDVVRKVGDAMVVSCFGTTHSFTVNASPALIPRQTSSTVSRTGRIGSSLSMVIYLAVTMVRIKGPRWLQMQHLEQVASVRVRCTMCF